VTHLHLFCICRE